MDLADLWAQHKKFILAIAGTLLLLLIGNGWIRSKFPVDDAVQSAEKMSGAMSRADTVPESLVSQLKEEVDGLRARYAELAGTMRFKLGEEFQVPQAESNPRAYFFRMYHNMQAVLVDTAMKQDIRVPDALGLKDMAPTDPEEIRRTLTALNVIQQVLIEAIGAGVRRIDSIRIEDEQRGRGKTSGFLKELHVEFHVIGGERSLRTLVAGLVDGAAHGTSAYLAVDKARIQAVKGEAGMLELTTTLAALQVEKSDDEEAR